jgi:hypothetical protein
VAYKKRSRSLSSLEGPTTVFSNSTTETTAATLAIPTSVAAGDLLRATLIGDILNNSGGAASYTFRLKIGATTILTSQSASQATSTNRRQWGFVVTLDVVTPASSALLGVIGGVSNSSASAWVLTSTLQGGSGWAASSVDLTTGPNLLLTVQSDTANASTDARLGMATFEIAKR